jgi:hypothetical protein
VKDKDVEGKDVEGKDVESKDVKRWNRDKDVEWCVV